MHIGITGTQRGLSEPQAEFAYSYLYAMDADTTVHLGDCIGADADVFHIARRLGLYTIGHPPADSRKRAFCSFDGSYPTKPYLERNRDIVDKSNLLIAFPRGMQEELRSGTWATVRYARKAGRTIIIVFPDGTLSDK